MVLDPWACIYNEFVKNSSFLFTAVSLFVYFFVSLYFFLSFFLRSFDLGNAVFSRSGNDTSCFVRRFRCHGRKSSLYRPSILHPALQDHPRSLRPLHFLTANPWTVSRKGWTRIVSKNDRRNEFRIFLWNTPYMGFMNRSISSLS